MHHHPYRHSTPRHPPRPSRWREALSLATVLAGAAVPTAGFLFAGSSAFFLGCPRLPPVSGCTPRTQDCRGGRPFVCSVTQRWEPVGSLSCADVGAVCRVNIEGVAFCGHPLPDAGEALDAPASSTTAPTTAVDGGAP